MQKAFFISTFENYTKIASNLFQIFMPLYDNFQQAQSNYIPQYVGLPLETVESVGDELANRHNQNLAALNQVQLFGLQQKAQILSEPDKQYIDKLLGGVSKNLEELAKTGAENATAKVATLANQFMGDEGLLRRIENSKLLKREDELMTQIKAQSGDVVRDERARQSFVESGSIDPETGKFRQYNITAQRPLDYLKKQDEVVDPLTADVSQTNLAPDLALTLKQLGITGPAGNISPLLRTQVTKTLSKNKVDDFIDNKGGWENYKSTSEYKQQQLRFANKGMGEAEADQMIKEELKARGYARVFTEVHKAWENIPGLASLTGGGGSDKTPGMIYTANTGQAVDITPDDFVSLRDTIKSKQAQLKELQANMSSITDPKLQQEASAQERALSADLINSQSRYSVIEQKAVGKGLNFDKAWQSWQHLLKNKASFVEDMKKKGLDPEAIKEFAEDPMNALPQTKEEFIQAVRDGDPQGGLGRFITNLTHMTGKDLQSGHTQNAALELQKFTNEYYGKVARYLENNKIAANAQVFDGLSGEKADGAYINSIGNVNDLLTQQWTTTATGFTEPITNAQVSPESLKKEFGESYDPTLTKIKLTDGVIGGKPVYQIVLFGKDDNKNPHQIGAKYITPDNGTEGLRQMVNIGSELLAKGTDAVTIDRGTQMIANAAFLPMIQRAGIFNSPRTIIPTGRKTYIVEKIDQGGLTGFKVYDNDGQYVNTVGGEQELAKLMFAYEQ